MKIVILMSVYGERAVGGAERTAGQMAQQLVQRGHSVHLISLFPKGEAMPPPRMEAGVVWHAIPLSQWYDPFNGRQLKLDSLPKFFQYPARSLLKMAWHVRDIYNFGMVRAVKLRLQAIQPDLLLTHTLQGFSVGVWAAAKSLGIKVVHMTHDHALICPGTAMTKGSQACDRVCGSCQLFSWTRHLVATKPDAVMGPSEIILKRHQQFGWFKDIKIQRVIPNALPLAWPEIDPTATCVPAVSSPENPIIFGFLGRIDESKGADTLIVALANLPEYLIGRWRLRVGGQGSLSQLQDWVLQSDNGALAWQRIEPFIDMLGIVRADQFMQQLHVLVTPSRAHETFCNVVMEAAAMGRPAVVSNRGALPERVQGGELGWIFPAGDAAALELQLRQLITEPTQITQKATAAQQTKAMYAPMLQIDRLESLLNDVAAA
jgi:glycosyltransferase involved in cell wall biosynthesis